MANVDRRRVLVTSGAAAIALGAGAQTPPKLPRVGILVPQVRSGRLPVDAFLDGLRELGHADGRNIVIEWRYAEGKPERLQALAEELVQRRVDIIHAVGPDAVEAARKVTTTVPIVGVGGADPVVLGWATTLARPGGNITGLTVGHEELFGKQLQLLKEVVPKLTRVAFLVDSNYFAPGSAVMSMYAGWLQEATDRLGLQGRVIHVSSPGEFEQAFSSALHWKADAIHSNETPMLLNHRARLAALVNDKRLPSVGFFPETAAAGFLMAYGPDVADLHRRAAVYADKILKGTRAGDLPYERPSKFDLVINARTARALKLTIPPSLLLRATRVIE